MTKPLPLNCPVARTLDVIGARWTALILRDLLLNETRRYQDLQNSLADIAPSTLSARLKQLESHGIVQRTFYEQHPPRAQYSLTEKGRDLGPVVLEMRRWGEKHGPDN